MTKQKYNLKTNTQIEDPPYKENGDNETQDFKPTQKYLKNTKETL